MTLKFLPKVSKCFCLLELPLGAVLIAFTDFLFTAANVCLFYMGMICFEDYCRELWLQFLFLAPYAWLCLAGAIIILTYFDNSNTDLLMFAILIQMVLVVVFLIVLIIIFVNDKLHDDIKNGAVFLTLGFVYLFFLVYFTIVINSWHGTLVAK